MQSTHAPSLYSPQTGFTLIELILVMVLLSILAIIAIPRMFNNNAFEQHAFFNDTYNAVRYAQKVAIASGCNIQVSINNNSYELLRDDSCTSGTFSSNLPVLPPSTNQVRYIGAKDGVNLSSTQNTITFDSLGRADNDAVLTIGSRQITVVAATGFSYDSTP